MDHRDVAIIKNKPNRFHGGTFLTKSFPVPIEIGVMLRNIQYHVAFSLNTC